MIRFYARLSVAALMIIIGLLGFSSCSTQPAVVVGSQAAVDLSQTSPNLTFITFAHAIGLPTEGGNPQLIGNSILSWEKEHPDRKLVNFQIVYQQTAYLTSAETKGIFIYSEPKEAK